jgi:hypothetical protein
VTGKAEIVQGEFAPLKEYATRSLQPSRIKDRTWAAIWRDKEAKTEIGMYDEERFIFKPVFAVSGLHFDSRQMWIDEEKLQAFIVYGGHLLRVALPDISRSEGDAR